MDLCFGNSIGKVSLKNKRSSMITIQGKTTVKSSSSLLFFMSRFYGFLSSLFTSEEILIDSYKITGLTFMTVAYIVFKACMLPPPPLTAIEAKFGSDKYLDDSEINDIRSFIHENSNFINYK